jgi:oleandomycin transport system ATP-binding protein
VLPAVVRHLDEADVEVGELSLRGSSLDEVFLSLTGHRASAADAAGDEDADQQELQDAHESGTG